MPSKLARSLQLSIRGTQLELETPVLVPSFSSKALVDVGYIFANLSTFLTESYLVSAYDISRHGIRLSEGASTEAVFLDSGGYEVSKEHDGMDPLYGVPPSSSWSLDDYKTVLRQIDTIVPIFATSFDHPRFRSPLPRQIEDAVALFREFPTMGREFLIKPESHDERGLDVSRIASHIHQFSEFDIVGVTEAELGDSTLDRMHNIARLRQLMDSCRVHKPLHIYGSLDPVCTPLYFLAGADIFDGLSWLRLAYRNELAVYHRNRIPLDFEASESDDRGLMRSYIANLHYLDSNLTPRLKRYLIDRDECRLGVHSSFFEKALDDLRVRFPGVV